MAHIQVPDGLPGILGPMAISPESTKALRELVEVLLRGPNTLAPAEREMIASITGAQKFQTNSRRYLQSPAKCKRAAST